VGDNSACDVGREPGSLDGRLTPHSGCQVSTCEGVAGSRGVDDALYMRRGDVHRVATDVHMGTLGAGFDDDFGNPEVGEPRRSVAHRPAVMHRDFVFEGGKHNGRHLRYLVHYPCRFIRVFPARGAVVGVEADEYSLRSQGSQSVHEVFACSIRSQLQGDSRQVKDVGVAQVCDPAGAGEEVPRRRCRTPVGEAPLAVIVDADGVQPRQFVGEGGDRSATPSRAQAARISVLNSSLPNPVR